ncbi:MAG: FAD-dependent oxidoreductase [Clostridiales bacterium]|nr:FAD-dependent oxidoreductase [Clostridiales bacterium]
MKYPHLFEPLAVRGALFRNRIFASPQGFYNVSADALPNAEMAAFYERKAMGGFAGVTVGDCIVQTRTGTHYPFLIKMDDPNVLPGISVMASAIKRHGAVASAELSHAGMYAQHSKSLCGGKLYGPAAMENKYGPVEEMPEDMILGIIEAYGSAAALARRAGFGMVTIHGGHGWLLHQFWSAQVNTRKDRWGGSFENRMRLPLAVVESVRKAVGAAFPIEYRMSGSECFDGGYGIDEGIQFAKALDGKVDIIHVSAGHHEQESAFIITHPTMFLPEGCNLQYAAEIKKHVKSPVATVGAFFDPDFMEETIASGKADIIALGRQSLADPDLPLKARAGREDEINRCIRCSSCFAGSGQWRLCFCATNPEICHELEFKAVPAPRFKKRVLIAGGGVAGMQAAISAAERGHSVVLCEKTDRLGGTLRCEEKVPFKKNLKWYLDKQTRLIERNPDIEVRLNTEVTPLLADTIDPDVIIAALGARPAMPPIKGIEHAYGAERVYREPELAGNSAVILGAGLVGLELSVFLAGRGVDVRVIEITDKPAVNEFSMHTQGLFDQIEKLGVKLHLSSSALEIRPGALSYEDREGVHELFADSIVYATGQKPLREEAAALARCAPEFYQIGDCVMPDNIFAATQTAYTIAGDIGRIL